MTFGMPITDALSQTLNMVGTAARAAQDDWWVIGSAAVALHGGNVPVVRDVDLMLSRRDAEAFLTRVGGRRCDPKPSRLFHSPTFGTWSDPPIRVEAFGGFTLASGGGWRPVRFATRQGVQIGDATLYVPGREELIGLLHAFGRPKDLERARLLQIIPARG